MNNKAKTGVIAGNFDVIHPGYIHLFNECKKHCSQLIIFFMKTLRLKDQKN
jgi:glycerol-3-phosphate cytidylyltransferase-like family protein